MWDWIAPLGEICRLTDTSAFWLRNVSDLLIGGAYALIPFCLASFLTERRDVDFGWVAWLSALFIALCGLTHWMHIWMAFSPSYTAEAYLKAATALASVTTAGAVIALLPEIKRLPTPAMLRREHAKRIEAEVALREALEERSNAELQRHIELQDLLINELNHRVKNTLATVQAMARMSFRGLGPEGQPNLEVFQSRILALSAAHNLLNEANWTGAALADVVRAVLRFGADMGRVTLEGPAVELTARETVSLALVLHELTTNAIKHGALRPEADARLAVLWEVERDTLHLRWNSFISDRVISPPDQQGFGLRLIRQAVERELSGQLTFDWQPDGLKLLISIPLERLQPPTPSKEEQTVPAGPSRDVPRADDPHRRHDSISTGS